MYTYTVKMKIMRWNIKVSIIIFTTERTVKNKVEGGWTPIYQLALLQLVHTRGIFYK